MKGITTALKGDSPHIDLYIANKLRELLRERIL
jgi:hypothetical protein